MALDTVPSLHTRHRSLLNTVTLVKDTNNRQLPITFLPLRAPPIAMTMVLIRVVPILLANIQIANLFHLSCQIPSMTPLALRFSLPTITCRVRNRRFLSLRALLYLPVMQRLLRCLITWRKNRTQECSRLSTTNFVISKSFIPYTLTGFIFPSGGCRFFGLFSDHAFLPLMHSLCSEQRSYIRCYRFYSYH